MSEAGGVSVFLVISIFAPDIEPRLQLLALFGAPMTDFAAALLLSQQGVNGAVYLSDGEALPDLGFTLLPFVVCHDSVSPAS